MDFSFSTSMEHFTLIVALLSVAVGYLAYWFISHSPKIRERYKKANTEDVYSEKIIVFQRMIGVLFLGIIPGIICFIFISADPDSYGLNFNNFGRSAMWTAILCGLIIPMTVISGKKPENLAMYPQIRAKQWSKKLVAKSAITWIAYLFAYEFLFRGILLLPFVDMLGLWPAVVLNIVIYSFAHLPKGMTESVGAIPLGLALCLITIGTGSIFVAFAVHVAMALTNEWRTLYLHEDMKIIK